jgi:prepilin-type N-terminal cleavage/methylation domain-containing protein
MRNVWYGLWHDKYVIMRDINMKMPNHTPNVFTRIRGFTLIELLIVIAILGVLATMFMTTFPAAQRRARDARRQSDIKQYQTAVEKYANKNNGNYYNSSGTINPSSVCNTLIGTSNCPNDPGSYTYQYNGTAAAYVVWARLEAITPATYFIVCSNGKTGNSTTAPTSSVCPL